MRTEVRLLADVGWSGPVVECRDKCICNRGGPGCSLGDVCAPKLARTSKYIIKKNDFFG